jgi:lysine-N-methylase
MKFSIRQLPVVQNWSCHRCGNCCREYFVTVTAEERKRIEEQGWSRRPEFAGQPLFVKVGSFWRREYRLAHRADGSCIFLDENGLCRIHGEFGERAKPIVCQFYPYMLAPTDQELRVSVRFSCPSAVKNLGRPVQNQLEDIKRYAKELIPANVRVPEPPLLRRGQSVDWPRLLAVVDALHDIVKRPGAPVSHRLVQAIAFARLVDQARVAHLEKDAFVELLELLRTASLENVPIGRDQMGECPNWAFVLFRMMVAQCARKDLSPHLRRGLRGRWELFRAAIRFSRGRGLIPRLQSLFGDVDFETIEQPFGPMPDECNGILERYYRNKLSGIQFFGSTFYDVPLIEGFDSLALTFPAILWIARWLAATAGRHTLQTEDVVTALTIVDHQWGFASSFGYSSSRRRVRLLASHGLIGRLIMHYA